MTLIRLFPVLKLVTGRIWVYLALAGMAAAFAGGFWVKGKFEQAKQVTAINLARAAERDLVLLGSNTDRGYLNRLRDMKGKSDAKIAALQARLNRVKPCPVPVPPEWLRGKPGVSGTAPATVWDWTAPEGVDTTAEPVADARDVVLTCERNRLEVHEPNAEQIRELQRFYEGVRKRVNR